MYDINHDVEFHYLLVSAPIVTGPCLSGYWINLDGQVHWEWLPTGNPPIDLVWRQKPTTFPEDQ
jgi:hypothetical protein